MRKVIVCNIVSLDGYYEGPGGNVMVLPMDEAFDAYNRERIEAAGTVLLGRTSYQGFSSYWPDVADAPADPENRALSDDNRALSRVYNGLENVVVPTATRPQTTTPGTTPPPWSQAPRSAPGSRMRGTARVATSWSSAAGRCGTPCWPTISSTNYTSWSARWCWSQTPRSSPPPSTA